MLLVCCAVWDSAIQAYNRPFFAPARGAATRSFIDEVNRSPTPQEPNPLFAHSDDFELHLLFGLDDNTGLVNSNSVEVLLRAKDVKNAS